MNLSHKRITWQTNIWCHLRVVLPFLRSFFYFSKKIGKKNNINCAIDTIGCMLALTLRIWYRGPDQSNRSTLGLKMFLAIWKNSSWGHEIISPLFYSPFFSFMVHGICPFFETFVEGTLQWLSFIYELLAPPLPRKAAASMYWYLFVILICVKHLCPYWLCHVTYVAMFLWGRWHALRVKPRPTMQSSITNSTRCWLSREQFVYMSLNPTKHLSNKVVSLSFFLSSTNKRDKLYERHLDLFWVHNYFVLEGMGESKVGTRISSFISISLCLVFPSLPMWVDGE
jgi:hypothetical protein